MSVLISLILICAVFLALHKGIQNFRSRVLAWIATLILAIGGILISVFLKNDLGEQLFQTCMVYLVLGGFIGFFYIFINRGIHYANLQWEMYGRIAEKLNVKLDVPETNLAKVFQHPLVKGTWESRVCLVQQFKVGKNTFTGLRLNTDHEFPALQIRLKGEEGSNAMPGWEKLSVNAELHWEVFAREPEAALAFWNAKLSGILNKYQVLGKNESMQFFNGGIEMTLPTIINSENGVNNVQEKLQILYSIISELEKK